MLIEIYLNNKSQHDALGFHKRVSDKHLRVDIGALREMLQKQEIHQFINKN